MDYTLQPRLGARQNYTIVTNINNTLQFYRREYCSVFFLLEMWVLLGERARDEAYRYQDTVEKLGNQSEKVCVTSNSQGRARWVENGLLRILLFHQRHILPSRSPMPGKRGFLGMNVLSSFLSPLSVLKIKLPKEGTEKSTARKSYCFLYPKIKRWVNGLLQSLPPLTPAGGKPCFPEMNHGAATWSLVFVVPCSLCLETHTQLCPDLVPSPFW